MVLSSLCGSVRASKIPMQSIREKCPWAFVVILMTTLGSTSDCMAGPRAGARMPNVVFILADDLGWADPGRYHEHSTGTPALVPTPNMNRLCDQGMMFTDAQLPASLCAPNRFSLLTGSNPYRSRPGGTWNRTQSSAFHYRSSRRRQAGQPAPHHRRRLAGRRLPQRVLRKNASWR